MVHRIQAAKHVFLLLALTLPDFRWAAATGPPIRGRTHPVEVRDETGHRELKMMSKSNLFNRGKGKGMSESKSSKSSKRGGGKGKGKGRYRGYPAPTQPPILDLVDRYEKLKDLRRTTPMPSWSLEETSAPQPAVVPQPTLTSTFAPTIPRTAPPTQETSFPPTWSDTPQPTDRVLETNIFAESSEIDSRQSGLDCELTASGLFGMPSDTSSVYEIEFLYQIYVVAGTSEATLRSRVAPELDKGVAELILPAFFNCQTRRKLQESQTIDGVSSRREDEIVFFGLSCNGDAVAGSDCYMVKGYVSVFASGFRTAQNVKDFVLPEIQKILQGNDLSSRIPQLVDTVNLNDDLSVMDPIPASPASPTAPTAPTPTTPSSPTESTAPTPPTAETPTPPGSTPSSPTPTSPTSPTTPTPDEPPIGARSIEDESFIDKMEWWSWLLLIGGGLLLVSGVVSYLTSGKRTSPRPAGQPVRSDDDFRGSVKDNSAAYRPPPDTNTVGRFQVAPATDDDAGDYQGGSDVGRFQVAPVPADTRNPYEEESTTNDGDIQYTNDQGDQYQTSGANDGYYQDASTTNDESGQYQSAQSGDYQESAEPSDTGTGTYDDQMTGAGGYEQEPRSEELGQLGQVDEDNSYHHQTGYQPTQYQQQQQQNPQTEEVSEYEEYIDEEYIEVQEGTEYEDVVEEEMYVEESHQGEGDESYESYEEEVIVSEHS